MNVVFSLFSVGLYPYQNYLRADKPLLVQRCFPSFFFGCELVQCLQSSSRSLIRSLRRAPTNAREHGMQLPLVRRRPVNSAASTICPSLDDSFIPALLVAHHGIDDRFSAHVRRLNLLSLKYAGSNARVSEGILKSVYFAVCLRYVLIEANSARVLRFHQMQ